MMPESHSSVELPVFDISQPISPSCLSSLSLACNEWGFFHIINHGVSKDVYRKLHSLSTSIFSLPYDSKIKLGPSSLVKTYTPHFIASPFFESLRVSGPDFFASAQSSTAFLPDHPNPDEFSEAVKEYGTEMSELSRRIVKAVLMSMGEDSAEKFYESDFNNCHGYLRINSYSPPGSSTVDGKEVEGLGMHTDMSCVTIVCQDEIGGLQVRSREGKWMDINPRADTLVVNVGDLMHAWSNGRLRSSEHRVVLKRNASRFSVAFFWCFEDEKVISAPDEVVGEGGARIYTPFVCREYLKFRESSERGKFDKVGFTVKDFAGDLKQ
ncbi:gibberellin beta-dioxygenase [Salix suchowensis]|nr:gibberellin beta-dioxygenase [Salix suchowensis]